MSRFFKQDAISVVRCAISRPLDLPRAIWAIRSVYFSLCRHGFHACTLLVCPPRSLDTDWAGDISHSNISQFHEFTKSPKFWNFLFFRTLGSFSVCQKSLKFFISFIWVPKPLIYYVYGLNLTFKLFLGLFVYKFTIIKLIFLVINFYLHKIHKIIDYLLISIVWYFKFFPFSLF